MTGEELKKRVKIARAVQEQQQSKIKTKKKKK